MVDEIKLNTPLRSYSMHACFRLLLSLSSSSGTNEAKDLEIVYNEVDQITKQLRVFRVHACVRLLLLKGRAERDTILPLFDLFLRTCIFEDTADLYLWDHCVLINPEREEME